VTTRRALIREFLDQHVGGAHFTDDEDIFASGYLNSLFAVQLVMWVEQTFGTPVASEDLDLANFRTVEAIDEFVGRKLLQEQPA
jgi:acyl carrier protein